MEMKKIKQLDIVFENCEVFNVKPQDILLLSLEHLSRDIVINGFQYEDGEEYEFNTCRKCELILTQNALKSKGSFKDFSDTTLEERVTSKDITHLDLIYEDGSNYYVAVPWEDYEDNQYKNKYQNNLYSKDIDNNEILNIIIKDNFTIGDLEEYE